jgi:hypothetical protein
MVLTMALAQQGSGEAIEQLMAEGSGLFDEAVRHQPSSPWQIQSVVYDSLRREAESQLKFEPR